MTNLICHFNLDNDLDKEQLAFVLDEADVFCKKLDFVNIDYNSFKVFIASPNYYLTYENRLHVHTPISDEQEEFWDDDDEDFIDEDSDWED